MTYDNRNSGTLGKNRNPKSDRSPEFTGKLNLDGLNLWVSGWSKEDFMTNAEYISLALSRKDERECKSTGKIAPNPEAIGNQPQYRGTVIVDGVEYEIVAWVRKSNDGNKFLSIKANRKGGQPDPNVTRPRPTNEPRADMANQNIADQIDFDDDIPF